MVQSEGFFSHLPILETPRLMLRKLNMADAEDVFEYCKDTEVARHVLWDAYTALSQSKTYVRYIIKLYKMDEPSSWAIVLKQTKKVIGTIGFTWINRDHASAEVGYSLSRAYWNNGYMSEALEAVIKEGFETIRLHRIEAQHETDNPSSGRVMQKVGMRFEGTLRGRLFNKGRYVDVSLYAILREDYVSMTRVSWYTNKNAKV